MSKITRRDFIKESMVLSSALTTFPTILACQSQATPINKIVTHPNVDNLRVVGITDPAMARGHEPVSSWARQNEMVVSKVIGENIDKLACGLTESKDPGEAWRTIFIKPPDKSWADTVVAIKTNNISDQHTRSPVIAKICHTLTGILGVNPSNIKIYDACHGKDLIKKTPFTGLPEGCRIENNWGGSTVLTAVPRPWKNGQSKSECLKYLVDGSVDILINIAMCKGHSTKFGGFTMTMKNHFGTFNPGPGHQKGAQDYLMAINQAPEILGARDKQTGDVLFPRQQLCLVDALWASKDGPKGNPSAQPNFLAMGVLSPIVDYLVATTFRGEKMGWKPNMAVTKRMLTDFGYTKNDLLNDGKIIEV